MKTAVVLTLLLCSSAVHRMGSILNRIASIDLPGPAGQRFDYLTFDYEDHYLLSAHLGPGILYVIDSRTNRLVKAIPGVPEVTGVEYVPGLRKVYTSDRGETRVGVVSLDAMKVVKRIPIGQKPNGSTYAEPFGKIYVSTYGEEENIIDVRRDVVVKTLRFPEGTATPQFDPVSRKVYVNLHGQNGAIAEIDPTSDAVLGRHPIPGCHSGHGMALDPTGRRAFVLCNGNHVLDVFDLDSHRSVATVPIPAGADVVKFDPGLKRIYAACASGAIAVIQQDDRDHYRKLEDVRVEPKVHSLAVDVETNRVYAPEQEEGGRPVARMIVFEPATTTQTLAPAVVFVCEHGAAKSLIATAYFNKLAAERGLPFRATFRGAAPQDGLSVQAVAGLRADGLAIPAGKPSAITDADVAGATHIFAMGCVLPKRARTSGKTADWSDVPDDRGYGAMRDAILRHVTALLDDLQTKAPVSSITVLFPMMMTTRP